MRPTSETSKKKRQFARKLLKAGKQNKDIYAAVKKKFGTGIGSDTLAAIRADIGTGKDDGKRNERMKLAKKLILTGKNNIEIREATRKRFGAGLHNTSLALIRAEMKEGKTKNRKKSRKKRCKGNSHVDGLLVLQNGNGTSAEFKTALSSVHAMMEMENVRAVQLMCDGTVRLQQDHEFTLKGGA